MRKTAVVTGSTQGLGLGVARALLARGVNVMLCGPDGRGTEPPRAISDSIESDIARDSLNLEHFLRRTGIHFGGKCSAGEAGAEAAFQACDITRRESVVALWEAAEARFGGIDYWINNAGLALAGAPLSDLPIDDFASMAQINLMGTLSCCQVAAAGMQQRGGTIFNVLGAGWDGQPTPGMNGYATTKAALTFMTRALAQELSETRVAVVGISPGLVLTEGFLREHAKVPESQLAAREAVVNVLADYVETISEWIAEKVVSPQANGETLVWLTPDKIAGRKAQQPPRELIRDRRIVGI